MVTRGLRGRERSGGNKALTVAWMAGLQDARVGCCSRSPASAAATAAAAAAAASPGCAVHQRGGGREQMCEGG